MLGNVPIGKPAGITLVEDPDVRVNRGTIASVDFPGAVIHILRPLIDTLEAEPVSQSLRHVQLQRMINGPAIPEYGRNAVKERIGINLLDGPEGERADPGHRQYSGLR